MPDKLSLKVTQASLNQTALDWPQNMANHYAAIDAAVAEGSDMVLMPELSLTGYEVNDDFQRTDNNRVYDALSNIAAYAHVRDPNLVVSVGNPWRLQLREAFENAGAPNPDFVQNGLYDRWNRPFNVQTLITGGNIVGMTAKANLYISERGYENRYFNEWRLRDVEEYAQLAGIDAPYGTIPVALPNGQSVPFGRPLVYVVGEDGQAYVHATAICEEKWVATKYDAYPNDDSRYEQLNIIPSISRYLETKQGLFLEIANASPPSQEKQDRHMHLDELASHYADVVVDTDGLGTSGATFAQFGHRLKAQDGKTISAGKRMGFGQVETTTSIVQINAADPALVDKTHANVKRAFKDTSAKPHAELIFKTDSDQAWDDPANPDRWKEEAIRLQAFWTYDYMRKAGSVRAINALSGGQDSAHNSVEDFISIALGMKELGVEKVCDDFSVPYKDKVMQAYQDGGHFAALSEFMKNYLILYYLPTSNNPDEHEKGARELVHGGVDEETGERFEGIGGQYHVRSIQDLVTATAMIFGVEDTTKMSWDEKRDLMMELSDFVFASPKQYTPQQMQEWADKLKQRHPKLIELTSAALPGQSIAYENFQARLRTVIIWAVANVYKGMARANCNLSEIYTNNTTAAGDQHGGAINPNSWLHKADQQVLMKYLEEKGLHGVIPPLRALKQVNRNIPSAGLLSQDQDQTDEATMQATMPQIKELSILMHHTKIDTEHGERRLNVGEVYEFAKENLHFQNLDDNRLFNTVANFYRREQSGQFKRHMAVIGQANGMSLDKQTSSRNPNLSGGSRDEIVQLGIDLLFAWAQEDGLGWSEQQRQQLRARAWQDQGFVQEFQSAIWNRDEGQANMSFNLRGLYEQIKAQGWDHVFTPLDDRHPLRAIQATPGGMG